MVVFVQKMPKLASYVIWILHFCLLSSHYTLYILYNRDLACCHFNLTKQLVCHYSYILCNIGISSSNPKGISILCNTALHKYFFFMCCFVQPTSFYWIWSKWTILFRQRWKNVKILQISLFPPGCVICLDALRVWDDRTKYRWW